MKTLKNFLFLSVIAGSILLVSCKQNKASEQNEVTKGQDHRQMMQMMKMADDNRISLEVPPKKAQHQLMNMRSHLLAVQSIIDLLSKNEFDKASDVASSKLGLSKEMEMMCTSFGNENFEKLGLGFHKSADEMSEVLKTKNKAESLKALSNTLNYCVECHATFKQ